MSRSAVAVTSHAASIRTVNANAARQWRLVRSGYAGVHVERRRPERTTGRSGRRACAVGSNAQQKKGEIAQRARERMVGRPPLAIAAHARCGQRPESLDSLILIGQPQAERKRGRRRRSPHRSRRTDRPVARRTRQTTGGRTCPVRPPARESPLPRAGTARSPPGGTTRP